MYEIPDQEKRIADRRRDDDRRQSNERRRQQIKKRERGIASLLFLASVSVAALALFLLIQSGITETIDWSKLLFIQDDPEQDFDMAGVELGMAPDTILRQHPNLDLTTLVKGEKIGMFNVDDGKYTIWFVTINGIDKAYRMRFDQIIRGKTESDILEEMGRRHGKPGTSDCTKVTAETRSCHFQWWPSGGIALNVLSTTEIKKGTPVTGISMIATDTYLDGKRIRNRGQ